MLHPISILSDKIKIFLISEGFSFFNSSEVVTTIASFDNVNVSNVNTVKDMIRTLYIDDLNILRGHLTAERNIIIDYDSAKFANAIIGKVYRNCKEDAGHTLLSHQCEGLTNIYENNILGYSNFLNKIYYSIFNTVNGFINIPSFTTYASPAIISYLICHNCYDTGCSFCGGTGKLTFAEGGIIKIKGKKLLSFCLSIDRLALKLYNLSDSRKLYI